MKNNVIFLQEWDIFNSFIVIKEVAIKISSKWRRNRYFKCKCICWKIKDIALNSLIRWTSTNCWCLRTKKIIERCTIHGISKTRIYNVWANLKQRCTYKNHKAYKNYGWRWITYDKKWETFEWFYEDMKDWYADNLSLDREDNDWNYCKSNCKWKTAKEQARNKRTNVIYKGKCLSLWCEELNLKYWTIHSRIKYYWRTLEEALNIKN